MRALILFCLMVVSLTPVVALEPEEDITNPALYMADIFLEKSEEVKALLQKVSDFASARPEQIGEYPPIVLMFHGPEIRYFQPTFYQQNQKMVDLAAKLDALGVIDMRVCQRASDILRVDTSKMPKFIEIVPDSGPVFQDLKAQGYTYF
ncbi:MAG: hypothetical protein HOM11_07320 [Methylococcales bacterium]|nr:hypothetical protein [Methylococcales bacterium]MBT7445278.1 hypothetical protein [Methylococcales bacterium]